jgi:hypothetical protein
MNPSRRWAVAFILPVLIGVGLAPGEVWSQEQGDPGCQQALQEAIKACNGEPSGEVSSQEQGDPRWKQALQEPMKAFNALKNEGVELGNRVRQHIGLGPPKDQDDGPWADYRQHLEARYPEQAQETLVALCEAAKDQGIHAQDCDIVSTAERPTAVANALNNEPWFPGWVECVTGSRDEEALATFFKLTDGLGSQLVPALGEAVAPGYEMRTQCGEDITRKVVEVREALYEMMDRLQNDGNRARFVAGVFGKTTYNGSDEPVTAVVEAIDAKEPTTPLALLTPQDEETAKTLYGLFNRDRICDAPWACKSLGEILTVDLEQQLTATGWNESELGAALSRLKTSTETLPVLIGVGLAPGEVWSQEQGDPGCQQALQEASEACGVERTKKVLQHFGLGPGNDQGDQPPQIKWAEAQEDLSRDRICALSQVIEAVETTPTPGATDCTDSSYRAALAALWEQNWFQSWKPCLEEGSTSLPMGDFDGINPAFEARLMGYIPRGGPSLACSPTAAEEHPIIRLRASLEATIEVLSQDPLTSTRVLGALFSQTRALEDLRGTIAALPDDLAAIPPELGETTLFLPSDGARLRRLQALLNGRAVDACPVGDCPPLVDVLAGFERGLRDPGWQDDTIVQALIELERATEALISPAPKWRTAADGGASW